MGGLQTVFDLTGVQRTRNEDDLRRVLFSIYQDPPDVSHRPSLLVVEGFSIPLTHRVVDKPYRPPFRFRLVSPDPEWMSSDLRWFITFVGNILYNEWLAEHGYLSYFMDNFEFERTIALPPEQIRQVFDNPNLMYLGHWYYGSSTHPDDEIPEFEHENTITVKCRPRYDLRRLYLGENSMYDVPERHGNDEPDEMYGLPWEFEDGHIMLDAPSYAEPDESKKHHMHSARNFHYYLHKYAIFFGFDFFDLDWGGFWGNYVVNPYRVFDFASIRDDKNPSHIIFVKVHSNGTLERVL